jgi:hypothetical protein
VPFDQVRAGSGFVFQVDRRSGPVCYAKYRLPDGRQVKKKIGPAWNGRSCPADGFFSKRTAEDWLDDVLQQARDQLAGGRSADDDVTFEQAAREWLRNCEQDRACNRRRCAATAQASRVA